MKVSTSKKGLGWSLAVAIAFSICVVLMTLFTDKDLTAVSVVASAAWAETSAYGAFYLWKTKTENKLKYGQIWYDQMAEKYGVENITSVLDRILGD